MCYTLDMKVKDQKIRAKENELLVKVKFGILTIKEAAKILDDYAKSLGM